MLAKVFHHVITLGLAMYQHIQSQTFLLNNGLLDMFRNARAVVIGVDITLFKIQTQGTNLRGLRKEPIVVVGHAGSLKRARWASARTS